MRATDPRSIRFRLQFRESDPVSGLVLANSGLRERQPSQTGVAHYFEVAAIRRFHAGVQHVLNRGCIDHFGHQYRTRGSKNE